jgi:Tfp pilus assembly protein PilF
MESIINRLRQISKPAIIIFGAAFLLRLIYIFQMRDNPFFNFPQIDTLWHHLWAKEIAGGNIIGSEVFFRAPLYPYFLGLIYSIFGDGPFTYRIIQSLLGSFSCVLVYFIALRLFNKRTALIAGLIAAFYSVFIYFDNELLITNLFVFLFLLLLLVMINNGEKPSNRRIYIIGLVCGLAAIARPTILVILPVLVYYLFFYRRKAQAKPKRKLIPIAILFAGLLTVILPVTIRNYVVGKDIVLISYQGGVNFWIGNNEQSDGKTAGAPGYFKAQGEYQDNVKFSSRRVAENDLGRELKPSQISSYWYKKGFEYIATHPDGFIKLFIKKLYFLWNSYEIESNRNLYSQRKYSSLLSILQWHTLLGFPFGLIAPLALAGIYITIRKWERRYFLFLGMLFSYQLILILFFITSRFRVPTLPFLIILAAVALDYFITRIKRKKPKLIIPLIIFFAGLLISNSLLFGVKPLETSRSNQAMAAMYMRQNMPDSAAVYAQKAVDENPNDPAGLNFLGTAYEQMKDYDRCAETFERSIELNPDDAYAQNHLGYAYYRLGSYQLALNRCRAALAIDSSIIDIYTNLGNIYRDLGQTDSAFMILRRGYRIDSSNVAFLNNYAVILRENKAYDRAITILERAVEIEPGYLPARTNLANIYFQTGKLIEAEQEYLHALELDADNPETNLNLAQLYMRTNRAQKAIPLLENFLRIYPEHEGANRLLQSARGEGN